MKKIFFIIIAVNFLLVFDCFSSPLISGISSNEVNIDTKFKGAQILLFGAKGDAGNIVITVRGPKKNFLVTKKQKLLGVWYNGNRVEFENSYSFFSLFSTFNNGQIVEEIIEELELSKDFLEFNIKTKMQDQKKIDEFKIELTEEMQRNQLYSNNSGKIEFLDDTLFKVILNFPKNIIRGIYTVELYLIKENSLISFQSIPIYVNQVGISAKISDFSRSKEISYGLIAVFLALLVGWITNAFFERFIVK
jgi:uncharacterized protein (TIGR02186 family)